MIHISGSVNRTFVFPAPLETAFDFYADMERTLGFLTHISLVQHRSERRYRMLYHTTELGVYRINMYCDIEIRLDRNAWTLSILPAKDVPPVAPEITLYSMAAQGTYSSQSIFTTSGSRTQIEYRLNLDANLPVPFGARLMPTSVTNAIAQNITQWRIHEIAEGFIERSIRYYRAAA
jgi:hypothetical protein